MGTTPSKPTVLRVVASAIALALVAAAGYAALKWTVTKDSAARTRAPDFTLVTLDGTTLQSTALRGRVVVIDFWATWCGPCRAEVPELVALQRTFGAKGVQFVGISMDDDVTPVRAFYREHHMNYPVALGDAELGERFGGVLGLPVKFVIDREGGIVGRIDGPLDSAALARELKRVLAE